MAQHILIEAIYPQVDGGKYPTKTIVGEPVPLEATIFRDGHEHVRAQVRYRWRSESKWSVEPMAPIGNDRYRASFVPSEVGRYLAQVQAWTDVYGTWLEWLEKKVRAGVSFETDLLEGLLLIEAAEARAKGRDNKDFAKFRGQLQQHADNGERVLKLAGAPRLVELMLEYAERFDLVTSEPAVELACDRVRAQFASWYEMFPRSQGKVPGQHATFREAEQRLPEIAAMGFDVLYLPPIHPIGSAHRKGRNNTLTCEPGDPGSPWAIGSSDGGHMAVHPELGKLADFDHFVGAAEECGLEIALDYAIQCSPDHPWVREHPEWFHHRPDGSIKYAENPPKKYQDVYFVNFDTDNERELWEALLDILLFWIEHGVKIFRVDNPHTKPFRFWQWAIAEVQSKHPEVIFLAEAFTRPAVMKALGKVGFTQSYTYFTWRNHKQEITDYLTELTRTEMRHFYRPNFFANTPDILPEILQWGGKSAFRSRLVLAATLAPTYGIYSGFELCENDALPGREEYANSEKYEIRVRDWNQPGSLNELIAAINAIRRQNKALQQLQNLDFLPCDNEQIICYAKRAVGNTIMVAVNLDPFHQQAATVWVPPHISGFHNGESYKVRDLLTGERFSWGEHNFVRLDPSAGQVAHILRVES